MRLHADDDRAVEGGIRLPVVGSVELVPGGFATGRWYWSGATELGQDYLRVDAFRVIADRDEHLGRGACPHSVRLHQVGSELLGELLEIGVTGFDFSVEGQPASGDCPQTCFGGGRRSGE